MGSYSLIRPEDDGASQQASTWATDLDTKLVSRSHARVENIDQHSPADRATIEAAISKAADLVCYFGHGTETAWTTSNTATLDNHNVARLLDKVVVSVACKTGRNLGPDAVLSGVSAWIGFNISVATIRTHKGIDPIGDAIVDGVLKFDGGGTVRSVVDAIAANLDQVAIDHDTGKHSGHPNAKIVYFAALALRHHVVALGKTSATPLK